MGGCGSRRTEKNEKRIGFFILVLIYDMFGASQSRSALTCFDETSAKKGQQQERHKTIKTNLFFREMRSTYPLVI